MSSIKRDVKKKVLPRPEAEKIFVSTSSPLSVSAPPISLEGFCSGLSALPDCRYIRLHSKSPDRIQVCVRCVEPCQPCPQVEFELLQIRIGVMLTNFRCSYSLEVTALTLTKPVLTTEI